MRYLILLLFVVISCTSQQNKENEQSVKLTWNSKTTDTTHIMCDTELNVHVYRPERLKVLEECITVTGVVNKMKKEADGDWHIQLKLDSQYDSLLNDRNINNQDSCLVLEIVCVNKITQKDVTGYCDNYSNKITLPKRGERIMVTGRYILDKEANHGWREIHPVEKLVIVN